MREDTINIALILFCNLELYNFILFYFFQSPMRMFHNMKDVGFLQVKVIRAEALMAADVTGKDFFSFCDCKYQYWAFLQIEKYI